MPTKKQTYIVVMNFPAVHKSPAFSDIYATDKLQNIEAPDDYFIRAVTVRQTRPTPTLILDLESI